MLINEFLKIYILIFTIQISILFRQISKNPIIQCCIESESNKSFYLFFGYDDRNEFDFTLSFKIWYFQITFAVALGPKFSAKRFIAI